MDFENQMPQMLFSVAIWAYLAKIEGTWIQGSFLGKKFSLLVISSKLNACPFSGINFALLVWTRVVLMYCWCFSTLTHQADLSHLNMWAFFFLHIVSWLSLNGMWDVDQSSLETQNSQPFISWCWPISAIFPTGNENVPSLGWGPNQVSFTLLPYLHISIMCYLSLEAACVPYSLGFNITCRPVCFLWIIPHW